MDLQVHVLKLSSLKSTCSTSWGLADSKAAVTSHIMKQSSSPEPSVFLNVSSFGRPQKSTLHHLNAYTQQTDKLEQPRIICSRICRHQWQSWEQSLRLQTPVLDFFHNGEHNSRVRQLDLCKSWLAAPPTTKNAPACSPLYGLDGHGFERRAKQRQRNNIAVCQQPGLSCCPISSAGYNLFHKMK